MTIREAIAHGACLLHAAGVAEPEWDTELLARHALGWTRADLIARDRETMPPDTARAFDHLILQRARRRPLQHLTGTQAFWRHEIVVTPDALIPRPETELLVETVLDVVAETSAPLILDVGTGSGCIALALASERPDARIIATDISVAALTVAHTNLSRCGRRLRVDLVAADLLSPFACLQGRVHVVASNPPYVDRKAADSLAPEVRDHEPALALFPPRGAEDIYRRLVAQAEPLLAPSGVLVVELGAGLAETVQTICEEGGFVTDTRRDLQGWPRTLTARRHPDRRSEGGT